MSHGHPEKHLIARTGWLRAAVLGANDGIISTASLVLGVASAASQHEALVAGVAGLVAGAMAMAAGEYVSVSSQADTERADLAREARELGTDLAHEREELAQIYVARGVEATCNRRVDEGFEFDARHDENFDEERQQKIKRNFTFSLIPRAEVNL